MLIARAGERLAATPPTPARQSAGSTRPLYEPASSYEPATADDLDAREAYRRLSARFPDARVALAGSTSGSCASGAGTFYRFGVSLAPGAREALRAHFQEIAQVLAGGKTTADWEIPFCYLFTYGIADKPNLRGQAFYVRLVSSGGKLAWRLADAEGGSADVPLALVDSEPASLMRGAGSFGGLGDGFVLATCSRDDRSTPVLTIVFGDWPGRLKPAFRVKTKAVPLSEARAHDEPMLGDVLQQTSLVRGLDLKNPDPRVLYLDPDRRHRIMLLWNTAEAGKRMSRMRKTPRGGRVLMGVVATDVGWQQPALPAGVYLLWWVQSASLSGRYWEVTSPDESLRVRLSALPPGLTREERRSYEMGSRNFGQSFSTPLRDDASLDFIAGVAGGSSFRFGFTVNGDDLSSPSGGWIRIPKP